MSPEDEAVEKCTGKGRRAGSEEEDEGRSARSTQNPLAVCGRESDDKPLSSGVCLQPHLHMEEGKSSQA